MPGIISLHQVVSLLVFSDLIRIYCSLLQYHVNRFWPLLSHEGGNFHLHDFVAFSRPS